MNPSSLFRRALPVVLFATTALAQDFEGLDLSEEKPTTPVEFRPTLGVLSVKAADTEEVSISRARQLEAELLKQLGQGEQKQQQADFKIVQAIGPANVTFFYDWSSRQENDYQDLSLEMQKRLGWEWDNYAPDWQRAVNAAKAIVFIFCSHSVRQSQSLPGCICQAIAVDFSLWTVI